MSTNRFHNKFHRNNHHTDPTAGDIDSNYDPIASASQPFQGSFYGTGDLILEVGSSAVITYLNAPTGNITLKTNLDIDIHEIIGLLLPMMGDVTLGATTLAENQILTYDGSDWRNEDSLPQGFVGYSQLKNDFWGIGLVGGATSVDVEFADVTTTRTGTSVEEAVHPLGLKTMIDEDHAIVASETKLGNVKIWLSDSTTGVDTVLNISTV